MKAGKYRFYIILIFTLSLLWFLPATAAAADYTLTVNVQNGTVTKAPDQATYASGTSVTLTLTMDAGYTFIGWTGSASGRSNPLTVTMDADKTITATTHLKYPCAVSGTNCTIVKSPDKPTYDYLEHITITATPNDGYMFTSWTGTRTDNGNPLIFDFTKDEALTATCDPLPTTVTVNPSIEDPPYNAHTTCLYFKIPSTGLGTSGITYALKTMLKDGQTKNYAQVRHFSINITTGMVIWYPHPSFTGTYVITVEAANQSGQKVTTVLNVTVPVPVMINGSDAFCAFMKTQAIDPRGYLGVVYKNGDNWHTNTSTSWSPQVDKFTIGYYGGLQYYGGYSGEVTFTNASTAWSGLACDNTANGMNGSNAPILYNSMTNPDNPLYGFYPGHQSDGRLGVVSSSFGVEGHYAKFIYTYPSVGSSGSEMTAVAAYLKAIGAFRTDVFNLLKQKGALITTLIKLDRLTRVANDEARYMSEEAFPSFVQSSGTQTLAMVQAANAMTVDTVPPMPQIALTQWPGNGKNGVSYFESSDMNDGLLFQTPMSIATLYRETQLATKTFEIDASSSFSPNNSPITEYHWVVTKGDPAHIRVAPLTGNSSKVRIEVDYHGEAIVPLRTNVYSNLIEVALFVRNANGQLSTPAFFTSYSMRNEQRIIENGRVMEVDYNTNAVPARNPSSAPTLFSYSKAWAKDVYKYDGSGNCLGWDRYMPDNSVTSYTKDGKLIVAKDASGNPTALKNVSYSLVSSKITAAVVDSYSIMATAGSGGTISPAPYAVINKGGSQAFTITPNAGYRIQSVTVDGASAGTVSSYTFSNITANHTIQAAFAFTGTTYTITASAGAGGTISPTGSFAVNQGANQTLTITPSTGYHVADVVVDGSSTGALTSYTFSNITANHTIAANFAINTYTLTITSQNGSVTKAPDKPTYDHGETVQLTAAPNSGYLFSNWSGDATETQNPLTVTMDKAKSITANFIPSVIYIDSPRVLNVKGATYILTKDIVDVAGTCFQVSADNITLDLNGHNIKAGTSTLGVSIDGYSGITVKNGKIENFLYGIRLNNNRDNRIENIVMVRPYYGIYLNSSSDNQILNNTLTPSASGIALDSSSNNNTLQNNSVSSGMSWDVGGIDIVSSSGNSLINNNVSSCMGDNSAGIRLQSASGNTLTGNTVSLCQAPNYAAGIWLIASSNNTLDGNIVKNNNYHGIYLESSPGNNIINNAVTQNDFGIHLVSSSNNSIRGNTITDNETGVVDVSSENNIYSNNYYKNDDYELLSPTMDRSLDLNAPAVCEISASYPNGVPCPGIKVNVIELLPSEPVQYTTNGGMLAINFTPSRQGLYSMFLDVSDDLDNRIIYRLYFGDQSSVRYYFRGTGPVSHDMGTLSISPPVEEEEIWCARWVEFSPENLTGLSGISLITNVRASFWHTGTSAYFGNEFYGGPRIGHAKNVPDAYDPLWSSVNLFSSMWFNDPLNWKNLRLKLSGGGPHVITKAEGPSYVDISYIYTTTPVIKKIGSENIKVMAATMESEHSTSAAVILSGEGTANIVIKMPESGVNYGAQLDTVPANNEYCTINSQVNGEIDMTIKLVGASTHTLEIIAAGGPVVYGDVDQNGSITAEDALLVLKHSAGIITLEGAALQAADVDASGEVTAQDALLILQYSAGIIDHFPVEGG